MYDYADDEVALVGWEAFVTRQWELIFAGYSNGAGLRRSARRWADPLMGGAGLPVSVADELVRTAVLGHPELAPEDVRNLEAVRLRMLAILDVLAVAFEHAAPLGSTDGLRTLVDFLRQFAGADV